MQRRTTLKNQTPLRQFSSIPVIDISGLYSTAPAERHAVAADIRDAARDVGFFYISGHQVPGDATDDLIAAAEQYFAQPYEQKMQNYIGLSQNHSGYVPEGEEVFYSPDQNSGSDRPRDQKEAYDINYDLSDLSYQRPMLGPTLWPDNDDFKAKVSRYYNHGTELAKVLFRGFALALGLEETFFDGKLIRPPNQLRLIHYPYDPEAEDAQGIGAHTDYECFTLLLPTADGLEVLNGEGRWIDAPVIPGCFVVNIGDMMELLSNGHFRATTHRVRKVREERYSFPLFCTCDYDTVIEPVMGAIEPAMGAIESTDKHYAPVKCGDHLYAQTIDTFAYLQKRLNSGKIERPETHLDIGFGREEQAL